MQSLLPGTCRLHQLQSWPSSSTACSAPMCKRRSSDLPFSDSQDAATATTVDDNMDVHILMEMLTLCVVALLVIIFIVVQVTKRRRQLLATRSTSTQTTSIILTWTPPSSRSTQSCPASTTAWSPWNKNVWRRSTRTGCRHPWPAQPRNTLSRARQPGQGQTRSIFLTDHQLRRLPSP